jgi:hypothetical protein
MSCIEWKVVIPSYNRPECFKNKTLAVLKYHNIPATNIYLFVSDDKQKALYESVIDKEDVGHIIVGVKGLPEIRNFIFDYFKKGEPLVSFDDDVRGFVRLIGDKVRPLYRPELKCLINKAFEECKKPDVNANFWGDYPIPNAFFMKNIISYDLKFIIGSFWGCFNPANDIRITIGNGEKEDYMRTIQFWERDKVVVRLNFVSHKTATYKEPGGLQSDGIKNRQEREIRTVEIMLKKWPQYIRRNKNRKGDFPEILFIRQSFDQTPPSYHIINKNI